MTIALHTVFDSQNDRIIWDVGHQSYVHKILTGRYEKMNTLRQWGGLSGFPKSNESIHDAFDTGHSSTSISAAVGLALARDLDNLDHSVVAVIGDGALTGGMAFEALNHAGHEALDLIVILNDNEMSISKNVGALSAYLSKLRTEPTYSRTKGEIESVLHKVPLIGDKIARCASWMKEKIKYLMVPGIIFEELGFTYIGPVDGHSVPELTGVLNNSRHMKGPILLHAITQKGRGYEPASNNPSLFHGIGPFDIKTGSIISGQSKSYTEIFGEFMMQQAKVDPRIVGITAAMTSGTGLAKFSKEYPERFYDVGICEQHAVTMAAGMAKAGMRPIVAIYSTFLQRAFDQILHDVALQNLPVVFAVDRAGLVGEDGPTHHGLFDMAFLRIIPNLTIMSPSDENELLDMLFTSISINGPSVIRYPRGAGPGNAINEVRKIIELGSARVLREGKDLAVLAIGRGVNLGFDACLILEKRGIDAALIDARFVKPIDSDLINDLPKEFEKIVLIEEGCLAGGFSSACLEKWQESSYFPNVLRLGVPDAFIEHGNTNQLLANMNLDAEGIVDAIIKHWDDFNRPKQTLELLSVRKN